MSLFRIICMNQDRTSAFAELVTAPLRVINGEVYYTDYRGRSWCCDWEYHNGRLLLDPDVITCCSKGANLYRIIPGTGTPAPAPKCNKGRH